jgi:hypothetical protein
VITPVQTNYHRQHSDFLPGNARSPSWFPSKVQKSTSIP